MFAKGGCHKRRLTFIKIPATTSDVRYVFLNIDYNGNAIIKIRYLSITDWDI